MQRRYESPALTLEQRAGHVPINQDLVRNNRAASISGANMFVSEGAKIKKF